MSASSLRIGRSEMHWRPWEAPAAVFLVEGALIFDTLTPQVLSVTVGYVGLARGTGLPSRRPRLPSQCWRRR
jgi:hypothetical protein